MGKAVTDRPRVGLCIRACNTLGLTVDASTARKIAFFQSGASTYDLKTQKPLDPDKSARLLRILNTGNFIVWFRQLLSSRQVEVTNVLYGHGCEKFRANDASGLFTLLKAIEAGEAAIEMSGTFLDIKVLSEHIKKSSVAREAGERPSNKINEMIKTGQLQWTEQRYPSGRLHGYTLPTPATVGVSATLPAIVQAPPAEFTDEQLVEIQSQFPRAGAPAPQAQPPFNLPKVINKRRYIPPKLSHYGA